MIAWTEKEGVWYGSTGYSHFEIHPGTKSPFVMVTPNTITSAGTVDEGKAKASAFVAHQGDLKNIAVTPKELAYYKKNLDGGRFTFLSEKCPTCGKEV